MTLKSMNKLKNNTMKYFAEIELEHFYNELDNGDANALLMLGQIKQLEIKLSELKAYALENAITEFELYNEKTVLLGDFEFSKSAGGRYNYKHCQEWLDINESKKELEKKMQEALKIGKGSEIIDGETGEIIYPAEYLHNKESISIRIKK